MARKKEMPLALKPGVGKYGKGRVARRKKHHKKLGLPFSGKQTSARMEGALVHGPPRGPGAWTGRYNKQASPKK